MFIKEIKKKNNSSDKIFHTYRLVESVRTPQGPRHRTVLNLGTPDIDKSKFKELADRIEQLLYGGEQLFPAVDEQVEALASHYAELIIQNRIDIGEVQSDEEKTEDYREVDLNSVRNSRLRTLGAEHISLSAFRELGFPEILEELGFSGEEIKLSALSVIGRLITASSERATRHWARNISAIDELLSTDYSRLSNNALYRIADKLHDDKEAIERKLCAKEKELFSLQENIILYDLTNTYFEGSAKGNGKAKRSRSKDKRHDRPLLTLGLIIDELGFPKVSRVMQGNVSEPTTLISMIKQLQSAASGNHSASQRRPTVLIDAGIASEDNLAYLKQSGYDYICVSRRQPADSSQLEEGKMVEIKNEGGSHIEAQLLKEGSEQILYCKSKQKLEKERAMRSLHQGRFEEKLKMIAGSLEKKGGVKNYEKVIERIGRLKEKYSAIAQYYEIEVVKGSQGRASKINWRLDKEKEAEARYSGSYYLRTSRQDISEKQIWELYVMLTNVEEAFRVLKSDLHLQPINHQKEERSESHIFITILAYHLLTALRTRLSRHGINKRWSTLRKLMSTHQRVTTSMNISSGKRIYLRNTSTPEYYHSEIYMALNLRADPIGAKKTET